jgi:hypothetical protein
MARNGSGVYTLPAGNPVVTGTTISSTWANNTLNDMASALTTSISSDGQTTPVGNLPMGGYNHTNVANASVRTNYPSAGQVQDGALTYLTGISGTDTIVATSPLAMSAYAIGQEFRFIAVGTNTTTNVTININGIGAKSITKSGNVPLNINDLVSGAVVIISYDGTQFQISNVSSQSATVGYWQNIQNITSSSSINVGYSATSAGPITIASGVTVTVPSGSRWVIL